MPHDATYRFEIRSWAVLRADSSGPAQNLHLAALWIEGDESRHKEDETTRRDLARKRAEAMARDEARDVVVGVTVMDDWHFHALDYVTYAEVNGRATAMVCAGAR